MFCSSATDDRVRFIEANELFVVLSADADRRLARQPPLDPRLLEILAGACAVNGRFTEAVRWQVQGLTDPDHAAAHPRAHERLQSYQAQARCSQH